MRIKRITLSTVLYDLYKSDYPLHIEVNREYWYYFAEGNEIADKYGSGFYKIKITYIRSGCLFYIFSDYKDVAEQFCPVNCFMTSRFEFAEINPIEDLKDIIDFKDNLSRLYRFDDTRTIVKNWDNTEYADVDESNLDIETEGLLQLWNKNKN